MDPDTEDFEDVQFLTGSPQRYAVLSSLCASAARPCELCDEIDATRTTIQRILAGFRERQWVVKREREYRPTVTGRRVCQQYRSLLGEVERAREFGPLTTHLDAIADDLPTEALENGRLTAGSDGNPLAAVNRFTEWFRGVGSDVRALSPIVAQPFNEVGAELLAAGTSIEFVIDQTVLEQSEQEYGNALEHGLDHDQISIYVHEEPLTFGLVVDETNRCCLAAYDDHNNVRAVLETSGEDVADWARSVFEQRRERSKPLSVLYS
ncbi:MarR family transcriptional regulator [Halomicroarcula sp. F13]|uniref:MarR family transcriptional regulator n=1 Tax=Haloarcula rubra TaxID=2487747 RepID=A0AAW4PNN5_9EURY|nr:MarR family transcriptional regulator [Halomicroarcula rubra]MBX0322048.1 MarR family transcriptional regulator [Halomicroarcula rubra]